MCLSILLIYMTMVLCMIDYSELQNLSSEERKTTIKILNEYATTGTSELYNELLYSDYEEIPVDIETFLFTPKYLGKGLINSEGRRTVYQYWVDTLKKLFPNPLKPCPYNTLALTGAIGLGKSFMAVLCMLYELYRMLCLKDPYLYYGLQPIDKITFAVMNITLDAAQGVGWDKLQQLVQSSEWFLEHGTLSKGNYPTWSPGKKIELICGSQSRHIIGRACFSVFFDEVSFQPNADVNKQKEKAKTLVNTASARMQSRFMKGDKNPTLLIVASSKRTEQSYMETFIQSKKKLDTGTTYIVDEPQWVIREDKDSKVKFKVAVGSKFLSSEVLPLDITEEECNKVRNRGYKIIEVPIGYYENFIEDIDVALTDIAGISTTSSNRYISGPRLAAVETTTYQNAFVKEIIEVGNAKEDTTQYWDFFDISRIKPELRTKPLYIHLDMSLSGDKTGIAGVFQRGKKPPTEGEPPSKDMYYTVAFNVSVKAPRGYQVSFEKNRNFVRWLKQQGFKVAGVSTDTYQSAQLQQTLNAEGFNTSIISVDRVDSDHICLTGDTEVLTTEGPVRIDQLDTSYKVLSYNVDNNVVEEDVIDCWMHTDDVTEYYQIETDNGIIKCTGNHLILTRNRGYVRADKLTENDYILNVNDRE